MFSVAHETAQSLKLTSEVLFYGWEPDVSVLTSVSGPQSLPTASQQYCLKQRFPTSLMSSPH